MKKSLLISAKYKYLWNMIGGVLNATISVFAVMIINRITNPYDSGLFTLGFANAMLLQHVGSFDSRSHQCTDATSRFSFADYFTFRIFTSLLMFFVTGVFLVINHYSLEKALATILLVIFCGLNNISDIFQGLAQRHERLDISGKSMALRTILSLFFFGALLFWSKNLYTALVGFIIAQLVVILSYDLSRTALFDKPVIKINLHHIQLLFQETLPLFLCLFLQVFIYNMPKYAIDRYLSMEMQTVYGILFMPASIISLFGNFIFRPILTSLSILWEEKQYTTVIRMCISRISMLIGLTVLMALGGYAIGTPLLSLFYATDITPYRSILVVVLFGGGFSAVSTLLYFMATAVRQQYKMLICYLIAFTVSAVIAFPMVRSLGLMGAAISYLISCVLLNVLILLLMVRTARKAIHSYSESTEVKS